MHTVAVLSVALLCACGVAAGAVDSTTRAAPYYRFWHGKRLSTLSPSAFNKVLNAFIVATVDVGEGIALVSYVPVLTPHPSPGAGWTETALVAYSSEEAYHALMTSPRGEKYEHSHWNLFNESASSSHVPPHEIYQRDQPLAIGNATDVLGGTTLWYEAGTATRLLVHNRTAGVSDTLYAQAVNSYIALWDAAAAGTAKFGLLSWVVRLDADAVYEYQLWANATCYDAAAGSIVGKAALQSLGEVTAAFANIVAPVASPSRGITYGQGLSATLPALPA